ncbi:ubiquinol-cytochrome c reductase iron-sulfur subunit [Smaragdicoccus niigatensis]|uniref:cytochrome bc1 complex Rieske iron-sulfur subunit n=1 Tax=Smaragdicoccus niigatensis TaxID=359359 RepID=UPI0004779546|nr:ubiquinol-cytochrome c reductase iron-sulfur subunit [Smaragdicoccus niigatensis]
MSDSNKYTNEQLAAMSQEELFKHGVELDGVDVAFRKERWPIKATRAERRAERRVAFWFLLSGLSAIAFIGIFLFWPWEYQGLGEDKYGLYSLTTPLYGLTLGISIVSVGIGMILYVKKFMPEEISIQDRHDGPSTETDRKTVVAVLSDGWQSSTLGRRKMIIGSAGFGMGLFGLAAILPFVGGMIKNPWKPIRETYKGPQPALWISGWTPNYKGETIYLRRDTGRPEDVVLIRPEDLDAGGMETVFPFRESERGNHEELLKALRGIRNAVMLIRLRPEDAEHVQKRKGQESFNYGDYFAYSKICTHLGCPTSLYEQQTGRILCPCHQSQFSAFEWGRPIFGPAARALPQLPITVNSDGYLVAQGDFVEALGPAFWERRS